MKNRALKGALALLTVLALTMSAAAAEGYMMVFGSLDVYADRDMTRFLGEIRDASVVYVAAAEETEKGTVYTVVFGDRWILRTGYASGGFLMPLSPFEAEAYADQAREGMRFSGEVHLLNADFVPAEAQTGSPDTAEMPDAGETAFPGEYEVTDEGDAEGEESFAETPAFGDTDGLFEETGTPLPAAAPEITPVPAPTPEPTPRPTPSPLPTVTPTPAPVTLPPTPTKNPSSCVNVIVPPTDVSGFSGEEVVLAVGATGAASFQWQFWDGYAWVDSVMEQASSSAMKLVVFEGGRERIYRCVIRGTDRSVVYTEPVRIIVQK